MSAQLGPTLGDIRLSLNLLSEADLWLADDDAFRAMMRLVGYCAGQLVWTYAPPGDGSLPDDDVKLARICRTSLRRWKRIRPQVVPFFVVRRGRWHLDREWMSIGRGNRCAVPLAIQAEVLARQGRHCTYCGDTEGPFHFDHIYPVALGGTNEAPNLTLACARCNLSKGDKTLAEWLAAGGPPSSRTP